MNEEKTRYILVKEWMSGITMNDSELLFIPFKDLTFHMKRQNDINAHIDGVKIGAYIYHVIVDPETYEEHEIISFNARLPDELMVQFELNGLVHG